MQIANVNWTRVSLAIGLLVAIQHIASAEIRCGPINAAGMQVCEAGVDSSQFDLSAIDDYQHESEWCWAACISMVFQFYGHPIAQERIVNETFGAIANFPAQPGHLLRALNKQWTDDNGEAFQVIGDAFSANPMTAAQDLAANEPLIIASYNHAMVLTAETYWRNLNGAGQVTEAIVRDPWPGNGGRRILSAQEWFGTQMLVRIRVESETEKSEDDE